MRAATEENRIRAFGAVNWLGLWTLYLKEVRRFMKVPAQTVLGQAVQTLLFMAVLSLAWGQARGEVLGVPFTQFLGPGLVMMAIAGAAFANASSSLIVAKVQGNSVDFLMPPLTAGELTVAFVAGAVTRGLVVGAAALLAVLPFAPMVPVNLPAAVFFALSASVMLGSAGVLAGVWAQKFDHLAVITNFVITPLTFLSGTFYSISILPGVLETLTRGNPFFHLIDGFRYGFIGVADGSLLVGGLVVTAVNAVLLTVTYLVLKSGWRMKA